MSTGQGSQRVAKPKNSSQSNPFPRSFSGEALGGAGDTEGGAVIPFSGMVGIVAQRGSWEALAGLFGRHASMLPVQAVHARQVSSAFAVSGSLQLNGIK